MRREAPFQPEDLDALDALLSQADEVVAMCEVAAGYTNAAAIGMRHDVDNVLWPAVEMARWEQERGYRSTYFILHTAPYWKDKDQLAHGIEAIAEAGHEIGFHVNAIAQATLTGEDPLEIVARDLEELRSFGYPIRGVVAHGDRLCHQFGFVNDEIFTESARPGMGAPDRSIAGVKLSPVSRKTFGFEYDPNWLDREVYLSDSGGKWSRPFDPVRDGFDKQTGQLHMLIHADWWTDAFARREITV